MKGKTEGWVVEYLRRCREREGGPVVEDIGEAAPHPIRDLVACTAMRWDPAEAKHLRQVALVETASGAPPRLLDLPFEASGKSAWSPDGRWLAFVAETGGGAAQAVVVDVDVAETPVAVSDVSGMVESCQWSPDGTRLALVVALPGAELSDVYGSGVVGGARAESWRPHVSPGADAGRELVSWDFPLRQVPDHRDVNNGPTRRPDGATTDVSAVGALAGVNVWEACWCGPEALIALTSQGTGEGAWYDAQLTWVDLASGSTRVLHRSDDQLCQPRANADGTRWSVLAGVASDRGLPAGEILVGTPTGSPVPLDAASVHVNDHSWLDSTRILFAGLRGLDTVYGICDLDSGDTRVLWRGPQTSGEFQPEISGVAGSRPVVVLESHLEPPTLGVLDDTQVTPQPTPTGRSDADPEPSGTASTTFMPVWSPAGSGTAFRAATAGSTTTLEWPSTDGTLIQGLLTIPDTGEPYPLVVHVHGGPVHAWRNTWAGRDPHTSVLVARGYAVLRPNPRGSTGRGSAFVSPVRGDMGGLDAEDILSGVEHLIEQGRVDPSRVGITGISYGGFMSAWLPCSSRLFAAAVCRSPATDWLTQHLTSNIAEFDRLFLRGDVFDPASQYRTRSPLHYHEQISTPILLTAGALDLATPPSQAQVLHTALAERGVETALAIYPEEGHGVRANAAIADQCARMIDWFERFMPAHP